MKFAFVIHPITPRDAARKYPIAKFFPDAVIESFLKVKRPMVVSEISGIRSKTGATAEGIFIGCPLTPAMMMSMDLDRVYERIIQCTELAKREGAEIIGLGAFTSVVGDGGITVEKASPIAVTTGNSYTVATSIEGALKACELVGVEPSSSRLAVVGATGSIGKTCARALSPLFASTIVIGRDPERTQALVSELTRAEATTEVSALRNADVVITVTSSETAVILPEHLRRGAIVCDVARPRDVSVRVAKERPDVLVIEGGVVSVPGDVSFGIDFGFPPKTAYACMSETMLLALEGRAESFTLGKDVSLEQVKETQGWAEKHGFSLAGFRSFERAVEEPAIERAREARRDHTPPVLSHAQR
ncbi:MAG: shikimate dehydrogenase [Chthonomonas sp.]|nr:shikimate dehydrogenase [Chthonomonas sp.]